MRPGTRLPAVAAVLVASILAWSGCGGGGGDITEPEVGTLEVTTATTGPEPDADGYAVSIDGAAAVPVGANGAVRREPLATGSHTVELSGLAANCTVSGETRRSVTVSAGAVTTASYAVACVATTGAIAVTVASTGPADADGYRLLLDGADAGAIAVTGGVTMSPVAPGAHTVGLGGLAASCRVEGESPRPVSVSPGATATVAFDVVCTPPQPGAGSLEVSVSTGGANPDADGYRLRIDGAEGSSVGSNGTVSVLGLAAGPHAVELRGVAGNCRVEGDNPRTATVAPESTVRIAFAVSCSATTGRLTVSTTTSGSPPDADGYLVTVDAGDPRAIGAGESVTVEGLAPGSHAVLLGGVATHCTVAGNNPRSVTVAAGGTATLAFAVTCAPATGSLTVSISGLPTGTDAAVTVTGPAGFSRQATATRRFDGVAPGSYTVTAADVNEGATRFVPTPPTQTATIAAGGSATVTVSYAAVAPPPSINLRIDGWFLTQSAQTSGNTLPLIADRDAYLRVFVLGSERNEVAPPVRVRIFQGSNEVTSLLVPAPSSSTPTAKDEERLASSWNVRIPRAFVRPGLSLQAEVDPDNVVAEPDESDNRFPRSGAPRQAEVRTAPVLNVRFVPVRQPANALTGNVTTDNKARFLDLTRKMYPLPASESDVHAVYTTDTGDPLMPDDANGAWITILSELDALRVAEGTSRQYYGVVRTSYFAGIAGMGFLGLPTAMGWDDEFDRSRVMAHELGHTWDRAHAPCGSPAGADPNFPNPDGTTGVYGMDMVEETLKLPSQPDIMGNCGDPWISDYTYDAVLRFRSGAAAQSLRLDAAPVRCLLVWGRVQDGQIVLEPAFEVVTRPSLPARRGPYTVDARTADGTRVFTLSFDITRVADDRRGAGHFAFAVPLAPVGAAPVASLQVSGPAGDAAAARIAPPEGAAAIAEDAVEARRTPAGVQVRWDAARSPMALVRDADTGEILSFARGGDVEVASGKSRVEVVLSDRVASRRLLLPVEP